MSNHKEHGFTLVELLVVMVLTGIIGVMFFTFFFTNLRQYASLQSDSSNATTLSGQTYRISTVLRGLTDIVSGNANDLTFYSYFYPSDTYVSKVRYYVVNGQVLADVTAMTSNPPVGTPIANSTKTSVIIPRLYSVGNISLFTYIDASNTALAVPLSDENAVKAIQVNLSVPASNGGSQSLNTYVSLRNRKTNL